MHQQIAVTPRILLALDCVVRTSAAVHDKTAGAGNVVAVAKKSALGIPCLTTIDENRGQFLPSRRSRGRVSASLYTSDLSISKETEDRDRRNDAGLAALTGKVVDARYRVRNLVLNMSAVSILSCQGAAREKEAYGGFSAGNSVASDTLLEKAVGRSGAVRLCGIDRLPPGLDSLAGSQVVAFGVGDNAIDPLREGEDFHRIGLGRGRDSSNEGSRGQDGQGREGDVDHLEDLSGL